MKASDLMTGDYVYLISDVDGSKDINQVVMVRKDWFDGDAIKVDMFTDWFDDSYIEPIPLTPEIMKNNGFKEKSEMFEYYRGIEEPKIYEVKDKKYYIEEDLELDGNFLGYIFSVFDIDDEDGAVLNGVVEIKSVHELQHALRLCGIEKEIVL